MALALGFIAGDAWSVFSAGVLLVRGVLAEGVFGQFYWSAASLHIGRAPAHGLVALAWLSVRCGGVCVLSSFSPPSSSYSGKQGLLLNSFSIELTVQCDGCLIWGLGWRVGLVAGLRVGQAYGVFHRPGFGLLASVPRSLSTQPPFATQALILFCRQNITNMVGAFRY